MNAKRKISAGQFQVWHVGKMAFEVRCDGKVLFTAQNLNSAFVKACWFNDLQKSGDEWGVLRDILKAAA